MSWDALAAFDRGDYAVAAEWFEQAYAAEPNPDVLFNLARSYGRLRRCEEAQAQLKRYLAEVSAPPEAYYEGVGELEVDCPAVRATAPAPNPDVDRGSALGSDPRTPVSPPPRPTFTGNQTSRTNKANIGSLEERKTSWSSARDPWAYGFVVVGGVSAIASAAYGIGVLNTNHELEGLAQELSKNPSQTWDDAAGPLLSRQERQGNLALSFGVAALLLESAALLLFLAPWESEDAAASNDRLLESVKVQGSAQGFWCGYAGAL